MLSLTTRGGSVDIDDVDRAASTCGACGTHGAAGVLNLTIRTGVVHAGHVQICGDCLAEALAIMFKGHLGPDRYAK